jgi:hypothetical protein
MMPRLRKLALVVHVTVSVGWLGALAAYLVLDITAASSQDAPTLRAAYLGMASIVWYAIVPLAAATLSTGLMVSLGTKWGLFRHYWTLISFVLTVVAAAVLWVETRTISHYANVAADPAATLDDLRALGNTLVHSAGGIIVLLTILVLNMYKPSGMTRHGWRKQQKDHVRQRTVRQNRDEAGQRPG